MFIFSAQFMIDMRNMLNAPEWFLAIDYNTIEFSADKQCLTFKIYFMGKSFLKQSTIKIIFGFLGPYARELEQDFSSLLAGGLLEKPTVSIPGEYPDPERKKKVSYRSCGGFEEEDIETIVKGIQKLGIEMDGAHISNLFFRFR